MVVSIVVTLGLVAYQRHVIRSTRSVAISADSLHYSGDIAMNLAVIAAIALAEGTGLTIFDPIFALCIAAFLITSAERTRIGRASGRRRGVRVGELSGTRD